MESFLCIQCTPCEISPERWQITHVKRNSINMFGYFYRLIRRVSRRNSIDGHDPCDTLPFDLKVYDRAFQKLVSFCIDCRKVIDKHIENIRGRKFIYSSNSSLNKYLRFSIRLLLYKQNRSGGRRTKPNMWSKYVQTKRRLAYRDAIVKRIPTGWAIGAVKILRADSGFKSDTSSSLAGSECLLPHPLKI